MRIPDSAKIFGEEKDGAYIKNPFFAKEYLTKEEAIDLINRLSTMLLIDYRYTVKRSD